MRDLWSGLWDRTAGFRVPRVPVGAAGELFDALGSRYGEPGRHYHTFDHIAACLRELAGCRHLLRNPEAVETAIWFHDAVYDPRSAGNEEESASLAERLLDGAGFSVEFVRLTRAFVLATRHDGRQVPRELLPDAAYLSDIDLSILGEEESVYRRYRDGIRKEYGFLSDPEFRSGRTAFLKQLLGRLPVYGTDLYRELREARALVNLRSELSELE